MVVQNLLGLIATSGATNKPIFQQPTLSLQIQLILLNYVSVTAPRQIQIVYSMLYFFNNIAVIEEWNNTVCQGHLFRVLLLYIKKTTIYLV